VEVNIMSNVQVLIVDDEERFLHTTAKIMEKRGVAALRAPNGEGALKIIEETPVDVVILDVKMPGMDGVETLKRIKSSHPLIEVIMLTGHGSFDLAVSGMRLGAFDYLMKPCDISQLLEKVEDAYAKKQAMEERKRANGENGTDAPNPAVLRKSNASGNVE
jgi:DNA-binding NtrC family response regulator